MDFCWNASQAAERQSGALLSPWGWRGGPWQGCPAPGVCARSKNRSQHPAHEAQGTMRGRRHLADGATEVFLPSWHLFLPTQCPSLPPPLYICPLEHFRILNSFLQTASSSKMCMPCMIWLQAPSQPHFSLWPPLVTLAFISVSNSPTPSHRKPLQACYLFHCFLPGLILPASLLLTSNSSFRSLLSWFPEILLICRHNYSL